MQSAASDMRSSSTYPKVPTHTVHAAVAAGRLMQVVLGAHRAARARREDAGEARQEAVHQGPAWGVWCGGVCHFLAPHVLMSNFKSFSSALWG